MHDDTASDPVVSRAGQVALVTGGSSGLGEAIARALAAAGTGAVLSVDGGWVAH